MGLLARGHSVTVVTIDSERPSRCECIDLDGVAVKYLPWLKIGRYPLSLSLRSFAHSMGTSQIVHCFGLYNFICPIGVWNAIHSAKPLVVEPMGMFVPRVRSLFAKRLYNKMVTSWMAKHSSAIIATSNLEASELKQLGPKINIVVRGNGIDVGEFQNLPERALMRERWKVDPDQKLVIYIGRISAKKNLRELVNAFIRVEAPSTKLVIAGPVSEPDYLRNLHGDVNASVRREDIHIEGPIYGSDLKAALSAADLFVLPSLNENFGNAAGEAVAAGVPVLLTNTCGIAPLIDRRAGLAVPLGIDSLAEGLKVMLDPVQRDLLTAHREEVKRELSWDEPIAQTERLYREILARKVETLKN
jgi:glycosyltransferase involved in cell wall biosynthesis